MTSEFEGIQRAIAELDRLKAEYRKTGDGGPLMSYLNTVLAVGGDEGVLLLAEGYTLALLAMSRASKNVEQFFEGQTDLTLGEQLVMATGSVTLHFEQTADRWDHKEAEEDREYVHKQTSRLKAIVREFTST